MKDRIDNVLVKKGYFQTRQKAKYAIQNECVYVNDIMIDKVSKLIEEDSRIEIKGEVLPYVGKGGLKLEKALKVFAIDLQEKIAIDIGASTGGFTDCMLQNGASKVYAIDVGHDQLDEKLKQDDRVINLEGINIRDMKEADISKVDFVSTDVSFISLTQVLDKAHMLLKQNGEMVALIKPQFEAGPEAINKNGVVKDRKVHGKVIEKIALFANSLNFKVKDISYSPIKGPAGNIEYLIYLVKEQETTLDLFSIRVKIKEIVEQAHKGFKKVKEAKI